mmetsp:Transcript_17040/g.48689  ORF Transcript_17040/g.48689 Transcript_17040/m.48689 type:complete len:200 (-) Transcript_17040:98-697(-)
MAAKRCLAARARALRDVAPIAGGTRGRELGAAGTRVSGPRCGHDGRSCRRRRHCAAGARGFTDSGPCPASVSGRAPAVGQPPVGPRGGDCARGARAGGPRIAGPRPCTSSRAVDRPLDAGGCAERAPTATAAFGRAVRRRAPVRGRLRQERLRQGTTGEPRLAARLAPVATAAPAAAAATATAETAVALAELLGAAARR